MGTNACWTQLLARERITPDAVANQIESYWHGKGARTATRAWAALEPQSLEQTGLGIAVSSNKDGWITILDSERWTFDFGLANHLARVFKTTAHFYGCWDFYQRELELFIGPHAKPPGGYPCGNAYYQQLASDTERGPFVFISFEGIENGAYDRGPEPHEGKPGKPEESALGLKGKDRRSYLAASASDQLQGFLAQTNHEVRVLVARGSVASAMVHMADSPALDALWILDGEKWYRTADTWDENGEPVCLVDESVNVVQPTLLSNYRRPEVFRAWLRGLLLVSQDPVAAEECIVSASESDWKALMDRWADFRVTIAERALQELARDQTVSPDERGKPLDELFERAREGDTAASRALESRAVEEKNVMLWRFARAISDGKTAVAKMYASRVQMKSTDPR